MCRALLVIAGLLTPTALQQPAVPTRDAAIYGRVNHLGWIVRDLDAVTRAWRTFGVTSIQDAGTVEIPITEGGRQQMVTVRRAVAQIGAQAIHWIQPMGQSDVFTSFLASHGEGVHHIAFDVPSRDRLEHELRSLEAAGIRAAQEGTVPTPTGTGQFAYLDTAARGGITVELEHNPATVGAQAPPVSTNEDPFNRITQLAFVVRDLEAVNTYWTRAGFATIPFDRNVSLDRVYRGAPGRFEMLLGFTRTGDVPFEWIQPLVGPSVYEEYVAAHHEGLHHLGFNVSDFDGTVTRLGQRGLNVTMSGRWDTNGSQGRFAYLDAERHGGVAIELLWNRQAPATSADRSPGLSKDQMRQFLLTAKIVKHRSLSKGVTKPMRLTLTDGTLTHDAVFSGVQETTPIMRFPSGRTELDFVDSYAYNIAAYRLAELVGLDNMMPVTVEREYEHRKGSLVWWVEAKMDEGDRRKQKLFAPDRGDWDRQHYRMHVFTQLVADTDRNTGNVLIDADWKIWMIDFTRAFRRNRKLASENELQKCDRVLLAKLRELTRETVATATKPYIGGAEIDALLARRDAIVSRFETLIAERGEARVLY